MKCVWTNGDCRLYELLPSVLLTMNRLPSYGERMAAARNSHGGWARVETGRGDWTADSATQNDPTYAWNRVGMRAGVDVAVGETSRVGVAMHGLEASAELAWQGGKIELSGVGIGVNATTAMPGDLYLDAQAAATWFEVDVTSGTGVTLKDGAKGTGYALALEAGRPITVSGQAMGEGVVVTPRAGFAWSQVTLDDFADAMAARRVSLEDASSLMGSLGVGARAHTGAMTFAASMDALQEFSRETEMKLEGTRLKATAKTPAIRFGLGARHSWGEDSYSLQATAAYTAGGVDNNELAGSLSLTIRF